MSAPRRDYFITDEELARWKPKPELVKGLLAANEVNLLFAPKNRGKTFLALDLAYSIATEQENFLGRKILHQGSVVYLCAEGRSGLVLRREAWRVARKWKKSVPGLAFWRNHFDLQDEGMVDTLIAEVKESYPDCVLVVIDTLSQYMPGGEESTGDMSTALHACQRLRDELKTTVLVLHHPTKKDETNERGGSGFRGGCADVLNVEEKDGAFHLTTQNARDRATDDKPIPYVLDVVTLERFRDEEGMPLTSCVVRHLATDADRKAVKDKASALDRQVMDVLTQEGPANTRAIARTLKKRNVDVAASLSRLRKKGQVQQTQPRGPWSVSLGENTPVSVH